METQNDQTRQRDQVIRLVHSSDGQEVSMSGYFVLSIFAMFFVGLLALYLIATANNESNFDDVAAVGAGASAAYFNVDEVIRMDGSTGYASGAYDDIAIQAKAAIVYDVRSGDVLYERNRNVVWPIASITKVMTAYTAAQFLDPEDTVTVYREDIAAEGESGLLVEEHWRMSDLVDHMLITSSNDGASALARAVGLLMGEIATSSMTATGTDQSFSKDFFVQLMNANADIMQLDDTTFFNESGLDINEQESGAYSTVGDIAKLIDYITTNRPDLLTSTRYATTTMTSTSGFIHVATNTNSSVASTPGIKASKTGYTELAGGNLALLVDTSIDRPVIIVVLGSSVEGRFSDAEALLQATYKHVSSTDQ